jgi:uncharacterized protein YbbK (DUF523 family)
VDRILVSACLLGQPVRWDGQAKTLSHCLMTRWQAQGRLVAMCPELAGGLAVPRRPAEIAAGGSAAGVLDGADRVLDDRGEDVTAAYLAGADAAVALARAEGCHFALLTDGSPSCGSAQVHDGWFAGRRVAGEGVTTAALRRAGVRVFAPREMTLLAAALSA